MSVASQVDAAYAGCGFVGGFAAQVRQACALNIPAFVCLLDVGGYLFGGGLAVQAAA